MNLNTRLDWSHYALESEDLLKRLREAARDRNYIDARTLALALSVSALEMLKSLEGMA